MRGGASPPYSAVPKSLELEVVLQNSFPKKIYILNMRLLKVKLLNVRGVKYDIVESEIVEIEIVECKWCGM